MHKGQSHHFAPTTTCIPRLHTHTKLAHTSNQHWCTSYLTQRPYLKSILSPGFGQHLLGTQTPQTPEKENLRSRSSREQREQEGSRSSRTSRRSRQQEEQQQEEEQREQEGSRSRSSSGTNT